MNLGKEALTNIAIRLPKDNINWIVSNLTSNRINKFERRISRKGAIRERKGFTLSILMKIWMILLR